MKVNKSILAVLSMFLILLLFVSSASAADTNETNDVLSVDESSNTINEKLALDYSSDNAVANDTNDVENNENILAMANNDVESNENVLKEGTGTYSDLANEIDEAIKDGRTTVTLSKSLYTYDGGQSISIGTSNFKVEGNGATIDMAGSQCSAFILNNQYITVNNLTIKNVNSKDYGAIYTEGKMGCKVTNCNFINNTAGYCGGAIYNVESVTNCIFTNNHASENGGACCFEGTSNNVKYCTFTDNTAKYGGAIYHRAGSVDFSNCIFDNNTATKNGNAISVNFLMQGILENNWWGSNNPNWEKLIYAEYRMGQPLVYAVLNITANPSEIITNTKSSIVTKFVWNGTNTDVTSSLPKRNVKLTTNGTLTKTEGDVGLTSEFSATAEGIYYVNATVDNAITGVNVNVKNPWYVNASAAPDGDGKSPETAFNTLKDALTNSELQEGNTIMIASGEYKGEKNTGLTIDKNLNFLKYGDGEAIFDAENQRRIWTVTATSINITGLTFKNGKADYGGAIYFTNSLPNSNINATFINNTATSSGGAISSNSRDMVGFSGNLMGTFINNTVDYKYGSGGAIYISGGISGNISGTFINNKAPSGGAIHIYKDVIGNLMGTFINNTAVSEYTGRGGAIEISGGISGNVSGTFINNTAVGNYGGSGGAIRIVVYPDSIKSFSLSGTFINNKASNGGAIYIYGDEDEPFDVVIQDSIFINNTDTIYSGDSGKITAIDCWFGNNATNYNETPENIGNVNLNDWLFLNATANPTEINVGESSTIIFELDSYNDTSKDVTPYDASKMDAILELSQTLGEVNKNITLIGEEVIYTAKQEGTGSVTGKVGTAYYTVNIQNVEPKDAEIIIDKDTVSLDVGKATDVRVNVDPSEAGTLKFDSYDSNIISITYIGNIQLNIMAKQEGTTIIKVSLVPNPGYEAEPKSITVTVKAKDSEIIIDNDTISLDVGATAPTGAHVEPSEAGTLEYKSNDTNVAKIDYDESGNPIIVGVTDGIAKITVHLNPNPGYKQPEDKYITVTVNPSKEDLDIGASAEPITAGDDAKINVLGLMGSYGSATGYVYVMYDGATYKGDINDGEAIISVPGIMETTKLEVKYDGDEHYNPTSVDVTITVNPKPGINVVAENLTKYYGGDEQFIVNVTDNTGKGIPDKNASITINGITYNKTTDANGIARLSINLNSGNYTATVTVDDIAVNATVTVLPTVSGSDVTEVYGQTALYNATFLDSNGKFLSKGTKVRFNINGEILDEPISDDKGLASLDINSLKNKLSVGNYTVTATNPSTGENASNTITVTQAESDIIVSGKNITVSEVNAVIADIVLPGDATGNVSVTIGDNTTVYDVQTSNHTSRGGKLVMFISNNGLNVGEYNISAVYEGDNNYKASNASDQFVVSDKKYLNIEANAEPITVGDNATVVVTGLENATGDVSVIVNGKTYTAPIKSGEATVTVPGLTETVTADVTYAGDENYNNASTAVEIVVNPAPEPSKKNLTISASAEPITVGEDANVIVTGLENATGKVTVIINNKEYTAPIKDGEATVTVPGLNETVTAAVNYAGDENYNPASTTVNITVNPAPGPDKKNLTIKADASPIHAGENATVVVTGLENATGEVTVIINGKEYKGKINDGTANIIISGLTESVTGDVNYKGDENYNPASTTVKIAVIPELEVIIVADDVVKYYGGPERFVANVYDFAMNPIANKSVSIKINGITYTRTTDDNGTASLAIRLGSGTYYVTTTVDNITKESMVSVLSTIDGADITKYYKNDTQYSVLVCDATGKAVGAGNVVTFNVNGRLYNRTTDANGIATLNINLPPGEYVITATNPVTGEMQSNNITVLPVLSANDLTMKYLDGSQFKANLVDGQGKPYKDQTVTFNVNGILYNKVTDSNGQAALNIRLPPGEYIITSSFNGANIANKITITG